jgi:peptidylprolyl isomerase
MPCFSRRLALVAVAAMTGAAAVAASADQATPAAGGPPPLPAMVLWHSSPSGLKYAEIVVGKGPPPENGQTVVVHFTGWLENGAPFDDSRMRGKPFGFPLGSGQVIRGWDEGVRGMRVGGKRRLLVPPQLGYGSRGLGGVVPPNATLTFDIELLQVIDG